MSLLRSYSSHGAVFFGWTPFRLSTRTALLTGRYPQWIGGLECAIGTGNVGRYDNAVRLREKNELGSPTNVPTIVRMLKDVGYATAITGKWHVGYEPQFAPRQHYFLAALYNLRLHRLDRAPRRCAARSVLEI